MDDRGLAGHLRRRRTALGKKPGAPALLILLALALGSGLVLGMTAQATTAHAALTVHIGRARDNSRQFRTCNSHHTRHVGINGTERSAGSSLLCRQRLY